MRIDEVIQAARDQGASDVHLEGGLPPTFRVRGALRIQGEPIPAAVLTSMARELLGEVEAFNAFVERGSADFSRVVAGQRCRVNVLRSNRGVGFAVRLHASSQSNLKSLNLHPDLAKLVRPTHGLVLLTGPTGAGKTSTLTALIQEINQREARHIITVESPIEHVITPRKSFIRQREVGRDTPSFEQALIDSLREDPDVLVVGELREPEVMRLTLAAAETGHLVLATMHSATTTEALQRLVSSFPSESQGLISAQLADVLVGVVSQRLRYLESHKVLVPECEVLMASTATRAVIRTGQMFKLTSAIETGAADGSYTFVRYGEWLSRKTDFVQPLTTQETAEPSSATARLKPVTLPKPEPDGDALEIDESEDLGSLIDALEKR